jgi:hypothetical protein
MKNTKSDFRKPIFVTPPAHRLATETNFVVDHEEIIALDEVEP